MLLYSFSQTFILTWQGIDKKDRREEGITLLLNKVEVEAKLSVKAFGKRLEKSIGRRQSQRYCRWRSEMIHVEPRADGRS